jgi:hypothetical protein
VSGRSERWIVIPRWDEFQHYRDRNPIWIKDHVRQVRDDTYMSLELGARGLLHDLRLLYAENGGPLRESYARTRLGAPLGASGQTLGNHSRAFRRHLEALNRAGFVQVLASEPLATETETEKERTNAVTAVELTKEPTPEPSATKRVGERFGNLEERHLLALARDNGFGLEGAVLMLLAACTDRDDGTEGVVRALVRRNRLAEGDLHRAIEAAKGPGVRSPTRVAIAELKGRGAA